MQLLPENEEIIIHMPRFVIMHQTVANHDAIGNDIEIMYRIIHEKYKCSVYAINQFNKNVEYISEEELDEAISSNDIIVIYHHSVYWEHGYEKLKMVKGKLIFKYHNITPESFFEPYNNFHYTQCKKGREQTKSFQKEFPNAFWMSDSDYNAEDLSFFDRRRISICPPFNKIEEWHKDTLPEEGVLKELIESTDLNVMFVGRVVPNKGYFTLLKIIRDYCTYYDSNIKLRIIGKFDDSLEIFNKIIKNMISIYGIERNVDFIGEVNDSILMAYYLGSDVMICCSEHEGFCVPIIEAQSLGLPVIALNKCAVPDTIGNDQLLFSEDELEYVAALRFIKNNDVSYLIDSGVKNYKTNFTYDVIKSKFIKQIRGITEVAL